MLLPQQLRRRLPDRLPARGDDAVGVAAVDRLREGLAGEVVGRRLLGLELLDGVLLRELHLGGREGGGEGDVAEEVEEARRPGGEGARAEVDGVGRGRDGEVAADLLQLLGDPARGAAGGPFLQGRREEAREAGERGRVGGEAAADGEDRGDLREAGARHDPDGQAVREGRPADRGERERAVGAEGGEVLRVLRRLLGGGAGRDERGGEEDEGGAERDGGEAGGSRLHGVLLTSPPLRGRRPSAPRGGRRRCGSRR